MELSVADKEGKNGINIENSTISIIGIALTELTVGDGQNGIGIAIEINGSTTPS
jgi:hypothetical protein